MHMLNQSCDSSKIVPHHTSYRVALLQLPVLIEYLLHTKYPQLKLQIRL